MTSREAPKQNNNPELAGQLKSTEKQKLEQSISSELQRLKGMLGAKEMQHLMQRLETSQWLDELKDELEHEWSLGSLEITDEAVQALLQLIETVRTATQLDINELKVQIDTLNASPNWEPKQEIYVTNKMAGIAKLEKSPLGKNIIIDMAGIVVGGVVDSGLAILKLLMTLVTDVFRLPGDIIKNASKKRR